MKHESDGDTNYGWCTCDNPKKIDTRTGRIGNKRTSSDHSDYSIIKISQNTEKGPGDSGRIAASQNPVRNRQITLMRKNLKGVNNNNLEFKKRVNQFWISQKEKLINYWISPFFDVTGHVKPTLLLWAGLNTASLFKRFDIRYSNQIQII